MSRGTREHQLIVTKISDTRLSRAVVVLSRFVLLSFHFDYMGPTTPLCLAPLVISKLKVYKVRKV